MSGGCVVLVPAGCDTPGPLISALSGRGMSPEVVQDEPGVMLRLAELGGGRRVLVIVEPGRVARLAELVCAVQSYYRDALCWQYVDRGAGQEKLTMLDRRFSGPARVNGNGNADHAAGQVSGQGADALGEDAAPVGQIAGRRRPIDKLLVKVPGRPLTSREIVTQQELTMLLGPVPGEAS